MTLEIDLGMLDFTEVPAFDLSLVAMQNHFLIENTLGRSLEQKRYFSNSIVRSNHLHDLKEISINLPFSDTVLITVLSTFTKEKLWAVS